MPFEEVAEASTDDFAPVELDLVEWHFRELFVFEATFTPPRRQMDAMLRMFRTFAEKLPSASFCSSAYILHKHFADELLLQSRCVFRCAVCLVVLPSEAARCDNATHTDGVGVSLYLSCQDELLRIVQGFFQLHFVFLFCSLFLLHFIAIKAWGNCRSKVARDDPGTPTLVASP